RRLSFWAPRVHRPARPGRADAELAELSGKAARRGRLVAQYRHGPDLRNGDPDTPRRHGLSSGAALSPRCALPAVDRERGGRDIAAADAPGTHAGAAGPGAERARPRHYGNGEGLIGCFVLRPRFPFR